MALVALLIGGGLMAWALLRTASPNQVSSSKTTDAAQRFNTLNIPLDELAKAGGVVIDGSRSLSINGQLRANNSFIINPSGRPTAPVAGQIYFDQTTSQLAYYNGTDFISLTGDAAVVQNLGGLSGNINLGSGLAASNGQLTNTGVVSFQGQTGDVSLTGGQGVIVDGATIRNTGVLSVQGQIGNVQFTAGDGVAVDGTTLTNTGVLSLGGQTGALEIGDGLSLTGGTLEATGVQSLQAGTANLSIADDGNGNLTISSVGGGTGTVSSPGGTAGRIAKFTGAQTIEDSLLSESGSAVTVTGDLAVTGALTLGTPLAVAQGGTGSATPPGARANLGAAASGANSDITSLSGLTTALSVIQGGTGVSTIPNNGVVIGQGTSAIATVTAGSAGLCLLSTAGAPVFQTCPSSSGITSVNGLTGPALTVANASAAGSTITINDASTGQKGIAQFNSTNFTASSGVINTIQDINTAASPTFAGINTNAITPSGALTVGSVAQNLTLQGANTLITRTSGANTTTLSFAAPTANVTYRLQTAAAGTYDVCTTAGNCVGIGGGVTSPGGTANQLARFTGGQTIGDSIISDDGSAVTVAGSLTVTGVVTFNTPLAVTQGGTGATTPSAARTNLGAAASGANSDITSLSGLTTALSVVQGGTGATSLTANGVLLGNGTSPISSLAASGAGQCLVSTAGAPAWTTCPGSGGVVSINGLTGTLTIANASGAGSTITINDASTTQKGIASFNSANFTVTSGAVNTIQNIGTAAAPTFGALTLSSSQASSPMLLVNNTNASGSGNLLTLQLNGSDRLAVSPAGNMTLTGTVNGQTISSAASFTGTLAVAGAATFSGGATVTGTLTANTITPNSAMTVGATNQSLLLQGNSSTSITATSGANTTTVNFQAPTANVTYRFLTAAAGTYDICTTAGNCAGVGGGVTTPGGTANQLAKFTGSQAIGDSIISDDGTTVTVAGALAVNTITPSAALTVGSVSQDATLQGADVTITASDSGITNTLSFATPAGSNKSIVIPNASGTLVVSASGPLSIDANGNITCPTCTTSGGGGTGAVDSLNGLNGTLILANASGSGSTITINDASTSQKGIAQFNSANFTASGGLVNVIQDINTTAAPTFGRLTITSNQASNGMFVVNNTNTGATGDLFAAQLNGANRFSVAPNGNTTIAGTLTSGTINGQTISSTASFTGTVTAAGAATFNGGATVAGTLAVNTITPTSAMTVGSATQDLTLQGANTSVSSTSGANTTTLSFAAPTANVTYRLLSVAAGTYDICTTAGNCAGVGGGVTTPGGTPNAIAKFTSSNGIANSSLTDDGSLVTVGADLNVSGALTLGTPLAVAQGGTGATTPSGARTNLGAAASGANSDITSLSGLTTALSVGQGGTGAASLTASGVLLGNGTSAISSLVAGGAGLCLVSTAGAPTWSTCPGSGGVTSVNGLSGALTIANASGAGSTVTINDASTSQKGIATFSGTNFTVTGGTVNTIQDINTAAAPTFAALTLTSSQSTSPMLLVNNTNASASGNLLDLQLNGASRFAVSPAGNLTLTGTVNGQTISSTANFTGTVTVAGATVLQSTLAVTGNTTLTGDLAVNGGDITSTGALSIAPASALTLGSAGQVLTMQGNASTVLTATGSGNTTTVGFTAPTANTTLQFPALAAGTYQVCTSSGNCSGAGVTLQAAYNNSSNPEITLDATRGALTVRDASSPLGGNLFEVQNNAGSTTYFAVTAAGTSTTGSVVATGNINTSGGAVQTGNTTRLDNSGNLVNIGNITGTGAVTIASSGAGNDIVINGADALDVQDAATFASTATFNGLATFNTDLDVTLAGSENVSITSTVTGTTSLDLISGVLTNNTSSGTQRGLVLQNASGSGSTEALLVLDNVDPDTPVAIGLQVTAAAGGVTTAIDLSDADIVDALNIGANNIIGTTGNIDLSNFDVAGTTGNTTIGGTLGVTGVTTLTGNLGANGDVTLGDAATDLLTVNATLQGATPLQFEGATADANELTLAIGTLSGDRTVTLPDETGTVCLQNSANCGFATGSATDYIQNQNSIDQTANFRVSGTGRANTSLQAPLFDAPSAGTLAIGTTNATAINLDKATTVTGNFVQSGSTFSLTGSSSSAVSTTSGSLTLQGGNSSNTIAISVGSIALNSTDSITVGSSSTSTVNIGAQTNNARTILIGLSNATNAQTVSIGSSGAGTSATTIRGGSGSGAIALLTASGGTISVGDAGVAGTVQVGNTTGAVTQTINVGNNATAGSTTNVAVGSAVGGTTTIQGAGGVTVQGGAASSVTTTSGALTITSAASAVWSVGGTNQNLTLMASGTGTLAVDTAGAGTVNIANTNATTVNIAANNAAHTINVGTGAAAQTVTIGSTNTTSTTTIQGGTGASALALLTGSGGNISVTTTGTGTNTLGSAAGTIISDTGGSAKALQVRNSSNSVLFNVDASAGFVINNGVGHADNLLENPGFEAGITDSTASGWAYTASHAILTDAANARSGNKVLRVTASSAVIDAQSVKSFEVSPGDTYYFEGWVKSAAGTNGSGGFYFLEEDKDHGGFNYTPVGGSYPAAPGTSYTRYSGTVTVGSGKKYLTVAASVRSDSTTGTWYFDDFILRKVNTSGPSIAQSTVDTANAFQVQNAAGAALVNVNTTNGNITFNQSKLQILGIAHPTNVTLSSSASGGSLGAGTYHYGITAVAPSGETDIVYSAPTSATTTGSSSRNTLSWSAVSGATNYKVYRSTDGGATWFVNTIPAGTTSIIDNGTTYTWATPSGSMLALASNSTANLTMQTGTWLFLDGGSGNGTSGLNYVVGSNYLTMANYNSGGGIVIDADYVNIRDTTGYHTNLALSNTGAATFAVRSDSTAAFQIQDASNTAQFLVDTTNSRLYVGPTAGSTTGTLLVLGTKTNAGDPAGVNGAMYYNEAMQQYRCYRSVSSTEADGAWEQCGLNPIDRGFVVEDDFFSGSTTPLTTNASGFGNANWTIQNITANCTTVFYGGATYAPTADRPGNMRWSTSSTNNSGCTMTLGHSEQGSMVLAQGNTLKAAVAPGTTVSGLVYRIGLHNETTSTAAPTTGVWWEADTSANANWRYCYSNATPTAICANSGVAVTASTYATLEIRINALGTGTSSVDFFVNGSKATVSSITVNTTNRVSPAMTCYNTASATRDCVVDYVQVRGYSSGLR